MTIAYMNIGGPEIILLIFVLFAIIAIGNYGRNTQLGYWGSVLLCLFSSPIIGFAVVYYLRSRMKVQS